ncbi:MAG: RMD1 family protein [Hyphomicrobiales bacterium]|uniref:RMD1 family protein n=1 Tax=Rhabdaerophilum calidifontis TaxID=2604328 RepID=UPI00123B7CE3|nr:RMD1 family protein [Rhabdaerophilum calidifontis]MCA1952304.1 RMD1 family protein [Hyphomicrobiales bacterium]
MAERNEGMPDTGRRLTVRAIQLGERIETLRLERIDLVSGNPVAFAEGETGFIVIFRFGVAVLFGLSPLEEERALTALNPLITRTRADREEETIQLVLGSDREDAIVGGAVHIRAFSPERALVIADALAKSVALASDERDVAQVIDDLDPFARRLAESGRVPAKRRVMLRKIGAALLVRQRVVGRVAVEEKPDVLWDRPDLERLYARVEDEFELRERAGALKAKLEVIGETATALTDLLDTERSLRLEMAIVALIVFEILITFYQMWKGAAH